jgi:hypothetical protein
MHLNDALGYRKPQASTTFLSGDRIVGVLELLKLMHAVRAFPDHREVSLRERMRLPQGLARRDEQPDTRWPAQ